MTKNPTKWITSSGSDSVSTISSSHFLKEDLGFLLAENGNFLLFEDDVVTTKESTLWGAGSTLDNTITDESGNHVITEASDTIVQDVGFLGDTQLKNTSAWITRSGVDSLTTISTSLLLIESGFNLLAESGNILQLEDNVVVNKEATVWAEL